MAIPTYIMAVVGLAFNIKLIKHQNKCYEKNMGTLDKAIRLLIAVALVVLYFTDVVTGTLGIVLIVIAIVFALTSFISFCPLYLPFGINTCKTKK